MKYLRKKIWIAGALCLCISILGACGPKDAQVDVDLGVITDYISFEENIQYVYTGNSAYDEQSYFSFYTGENSVQRLISAFGLITTEILEYNESEGVLTSHMPGTHWSKKATAEDFEKGTSAVVLKEPLELGASWETSSGYSSIGNLKGVSTITAVGEVIETPAGEFEVFEVTTDFEGTNYDVRYYAKDVGLVRTDYYTQAVGGGSYTGGKLESSSVLAEINEDASFEMYIGVYYPDDEIENILIETLPVQLKTNPDIPALLTDILKTTSPEGRGGLISENTKILSAGIESGIVHVDFSKELPMEMNAGVAYEALLVDSIALTLMDFFSIGDLMLTVEGQPYESGHFIIEADHIFNYSDMNEEYIKKAAEKEAEETEEEEEPVSTP